MSLEQKYERPMITVVGGKECKPVKHEKDDLLWCKVCGEAVGIYCEAEQGYIYDGNYCKCCGTKITE